MVGSSPGGGYDAIARMVARHLGQHIPGHPTVVVENTPGGGSITMSNRIYRTEPQDGTVLGMVQRGVLLAQLIKQPNVQFDIAKFNWIGSVSPDTSLVVAWHTAPVKTIQDLFAHQLIVGGTGATSDLESSARLLNATIGTKFKIISGYPGQADVLLAMERDEIQGSADWSWSEIKTREANYLKEKKIVLILQNALVKSPELPDIPLATDFIKGDTDRQVANIYFGLQNWRGRCWQDPECRMIGSTLCAMPSRRSGATPDTWPTCRSLASVTRRPGPKSTGSSTLPHLPRPRW